MTQSRRKLPIGIQDGREAAHSMGCAEDLDSAALLQSAVPLAD
jgi:hypothetical protein